MVFHQPKMAIISILGVRLSRFELLTSCLSSKRSKPTELKPRKADAKIRNFNRDLQIILRKWGQIRIIFHKFVV